MYPVNNYSLFVAAFVSNSNYNVATNTTLANFDYKSEIIMRGFEIFKREVLQMTARQNYVYDYFQIILWYTCMLSIINIY